MKQSGPINFVQQAQACSHGQWQHVSNGVVDVLLPNRTQDYVSPALMMQDILRQLGYTTTPDLADHVRSNLVCGYITSKLFGEENERVGWTRKLKGSR